MTDEVFTSEFEMSFREESEQGYLEGIAIPYGQVVNVTERGESFRESFDPGSVELDGTVWLYRQHTVPIGEVIEVQDRAEGLWVRAKVAMSDLAQSTRELLRNGALKSLSAGFTTISTREDNGVRYVTRARLREVSVVERPAYSLATVLSIREESDDRTSVEINHREESEVTDSTTVDLTEVRADIEELSRRFDSFTPTAATEETDTRSAGEILKAVASGDAETIERYNEIQKRAYTGGTSADAPMKNAWVGDLTRIYDATSGVLSAFFANGTLPEKGKFLEFAELGTNTVKFEEQANEGDDLAYGKVTLATRTAPVKTFGGYVQLTRQEIERSNLPLLDRSLEALAIAAGARKKVEFRSVYNAAVTAREAVASNGGVVVLGATLAAANAGNWEDALVDTAIRYDSLDANPEALIVSASVFKKLRSLTVTGERVFSVGEGNRSGTLNLPGLTGSLAGLPVYLDAGQTGDKAVFVNSRAIRQYDSAIVSLQDENIINLSKDFSAYRYGAIAVEVPQLIVPVKLAAS